MADRQGIHTIFIFCYSATIATVCETFPPICLNFFFTFSTLYDSQMSVFFQFLKICFLQCDMTDGLTE